MKKLTALPAILALFALSAGNAQAEPKNGFGLNGGLTTQHMTSPAGNYQGNGVSIGVDYQIALSDSFSLNPFIMGSGENASGAVTPGTNSSHGILGLQLRYWMDNVFIGGHLGIYDETLSLKTGNVTTGTTVSGGGGGLVAGWEKPDGGLFFMGQLDSANLKYQTYTSKLSGFRISIGYRWK